MTDKQQPEALRLAELLTADEWPGHMTLVSYARECAAELRRQHTRIAELEARIKTMAEEHADELMVAHLDGRMRAAQPAGAQQPAPSAACPVGNSDFDHQTAADVLNGKTVSDEVMRKFVAASRWAHDDRVGLRATLLSVRGELASREAEIALLKKALMDAEAPRPSPAAQGDALDAAKHCLEMGESFRALRRVVNLLLEARRNLGPEDHELRDRIDRLLRDDAARAAQEGK